MSSLAVKIESLFDFCTFGDFDGDFDGDFSSLIGSVVDCDGERERRASRTLLLRDGKYDE